MSFFLVERERESGLLRLLSETLFDSREEALTELPAIMADKAGGASEVFVADLDAATPVLFVPQPSSTAPEAADESPAMPEIDEPTPAEEVKEEVAEVEEAIVAEAPADEPEPEITETIVAETPADEFESDLAAALRRAANSLESEGIVPPESIPADVATPEVPSSLEDDAVAKIVAELAADSPATESAQPEAEPEALSDIAIEDDIAATIASLGAPEEAEEAPASIAEEESPADEWPWANVVPVSEPAGDDGAVEEPDDTQDGAPEQPVEMSPDEVDMVFTSQDSADFTPRPVIMGDYADAPVVEVPAEEVAPVPEPEAELAAEPEPAQDSEPVVEIAVETQAPAEEASVADETPMPAYEPGDVSLEEYTCEDCVYANTCPKAGSSSPAECGSFQWKTA